MFALVMDSIINHIIIHCQRCCSHTYTIHYIVEYVVHNKKKVKNYNTFIETSRHTHI